MSGIQDLSSLFARLGYRFLISESMGKFVHASKHSDHFLSPPASNQSSLFEAESFILGTVRPMPVPALRSQGSSSS